MLMAEWRNSFRQKGEGAIAQALRGYGATSGSREHIGVGERIGNGDHTGARPSGEPAASRAESPSASHTA